jgi:hypothetical protein
VQIGIFPIIILIGRPAAGKSEIIAYLRDVSRERRKSDFHIGEFAEIDDFPMLWTWLEEDEILAEMGKPRLHIDEEGYFKFPYLWNLLIRRMELNYRKLLRDDPDFESDKTAIIEFSRGKEHGGFREALSHFSPYVLCRAAVLYTDVSYEESLRKNRRRFNPQRPDSILEHGLSDEKLKKLYEKSDWLDIAATDPTHIHIGAVRLPYAVLDNSDDITTRGGETLGQRLKETLKDLWKLYSHR